MFKNNFQFGEWAFKFVSSLPPVTGPFVFVCFFLFFQLATVFCHSLNSKSVFIVLVLSRRSGSFTLHFVFEHVSHYFLLWVFPLHPESCKTYFPHYFSNPMSFINFLPLVYQVLFSLNFPFHLTFPVFTVLSACLLYQSSPNLTQFALSEDIISSF